MIEDIDNNPEESEVEPAEPVKKRNTGLRALVIVVIALAVLVGVSYMPLYKWSGGKLKDFNLLSDIFPMLDTDTTSAVSGDEGIDPELRQAMNEGPAVITGVPSDSAAAQVPVLDENGAVIAYKPAAGAAQNDSILIAEKPARVGDLVQIEDYTASQTGLSKLRSALAAGRLARIAVLGDSYIEGDIFTQDVRAQLQTAHGGSGVGYMSLFSDFPGFRRSVKQGGKGWSTYASNKKGEKAYMGISEHYFKPSGEGTATYSGTSALANADKWETSRFLFIAPKGGTVKVKTSGEWATHELTPSSDVQAITVPGVTTDFAVSSSTPSIIGLGVWLDADRGISVDCMSSRGFSGISLRNVNAELCRQMSKFINYDLIVLEFGINAMSSKQTDYSVYSRRMEEVVNHMRACYPGADILIMGVGDRGEKRGGEVHSMPTGRNMIAAQREVARRTHSLFWDTREAMGGQDAIVSWASNGLANKDYIHLTHKGGRELATRFVSAINHNLKK
ncbi:MAG: GDSL-type esterase/lipase family protein [Muribaculaceae bacterium]|nr:GDSL-type esterase/lipase family protein [Muribaculaceae bacterium]